MKNTSASKYRCSRPQLVQNDDAENYKWFKIQTLETITDLK